MMGILKYRSMIPNDKPDWLTYLSTEVTTKFSDEVEDSQEFWERLNGFIIDYLWNLMDRRARHPFIKSNITTKIVSDEGKTVLQIRRNRKVVQTYSLEASPNPSEGRGDNQEDVITNS